MKKKYFQILNIKNIAVIHTEMKDVCQIIKKFGLHGIHQLIKDIRKTFINLLVKFITKFKTEKNIFLTLNPFFKIR